MMRMNEPLSGPVVATKRENVLHISSGKIEWPRGEPRGKKDMKLAESLNPQSLVYVLIQQYPDLKWRQIIQVLRFILTFMMIYTLDSSFIIKGFLFIFN